MSFTTHLLCVADTIISILEVRKLRVSGQFGSLRSQNQGAKSPSSFSVCTAESSTIEPRVNPDHLVPEISRETRMHRIE